MGKFLNALQDMIIFCEIKNLNIKQANTAFWNFFKIQETSFPLPSLFGKSFSLKNCTEEIKEKGSHCFYFPYKKNDELIQIKFHVSVSKIEEDILICFQGKTINQEKDKLNLLYDLRQMFHEGNSSEELKNSLENLETALFSKSLVQKTNIDSPSNSFVDVDTDKFKVLIVEDNRVNAKLIKRILSKQSFIVKLAENGKIGLETWQEEKFDLILMDLQMPIMNGFEATKEIRRIEKEEGLEKTPIIAVSANILEEDKSICLRAGMDEFVQKPIQTKALLEMIKKVV